jgi:hypothetical protein
MKKKYFCPLRGKTVSGESLSNARQNLCHNIPDEQKGAEPHKCPRSYFCELLQEAES